jgi:hypothetical protein
VAQNNLFAPAEKKKTSANRFPERPSEPILGKLRLENSPPMSQSGTANQNANPLISWIYISVSTMKMLQE